MRFTIHLDHITMPFCRELQALAKKYKGKTPLEARIVDRKNDLILTMRSREMMVNPRKMIAALDKMTEVQDITPVLAQI